MLYKVLAHAEYISISSVAEQASDIQLGILESLHDRPNSERTLYKKMERESYVDISMYRGR